MLVFFTFASTRNPIRELAALSLSSVRCPATVLLKGRLPKLVCRLVPELVLRNVLVKSIKPIGVIVASPILICSGAGCSCACGGRAGDAGNTVAVTAADLAAVEGCDAAGVGSV